MRRWNGDAAHFVSSTVQREPNNSFVSQSALSLGSLARSAETSERAARSQGEGEREREKRATTMWQGFITGDISYRASFTGAYVETLRDMRRAAVVDERV